MTPSCQIILNTNDNVSQNPNPDLFQTSVTNTKTEGMYSAPPVFFAQSTKQRIYLYFEFTAPNSYS